MRSQFFDTLRCSQSQQADNKPTSVEGSPPSSGEQQANKCRRLTNTKKVGVIEANIQPTSAKGSPTPKVRLTEANNKRNISRQQQEEHQPTTSSP